MPSPNQDTMATHRKTMLDHLAADRQPANRKRAQQAALAIERMDDGTYGFCTACGLQIPELRLFRKPEATRCRNCEQAD